MGCKCFKYSKVESEQNSRRENLENIPKSLLDVQIKTENFVKKRNQSVYNIYRKELLLGQGAFSEVYKVQKIGGDEVRAIKEIMKSTSEETTKDILNEIEILKKLDHPNIVKIYEYFEDPEMIYLVEDYYEEGELSDKMDKYGVFCEFLVKYIMYHIFIGVSFLHSSHVVHGDIKRENILLSFQKKNEDNEDIFRKICESREIQKKLINAPNLDSLSPEDKKIVKELATIEVLISDFGSAKMKKSSENDKKITGITGTTIYCSPEVLNGNYDYECDEWSCGVLMYILLTGLSPFGGRTDEEIQNNILDGNVDFNIDRLKNVSDCCKDLMSKLLEIDSQKRIKSYAALQHEFFTKGIDIGKLMQGDSTANIQKLSSFVERATMARNRKEGKRSVFRDTVIAYMALNFTDKEEASQMKSIFRELAENNPKYEITKGTFIEKMKEILKDNYSEKELSDLFDTLDNDMSGKIEYEELNRALGDQSKLINERNLRETFNFFDEDKNGKISIKEISDIVFKGKEMSPNIMKEFLEQIGLEDENSKDITFEKFVEIMGYKNLLK